MKHIETGLFILGALTIAAGAVILFIMIVFADRVMPQGTVPLPGLFGGLGFILAGALLVGQGAWLNHLRAIREHRA